MENLRGVNLGGWLILEKWMTPSVFEGTDAHDEYTFSQTVNAATKLKHHRETFITEADFKWLSTNGVTAIRIPVGYWLLDGDPPYMKGSQYLDWAFDMARKYNLAVLLDIHALPGSQNGNDHSGRIGAALWQKDSEFQHRSLDAIQAFAQRYGTHPALWGIEIINEPNAGAFQIPLRRYYVRAYRILAQVLPPYVRIVYSDAWSPRLFAFALLGRSRAVMDVHLYHMATLGAKTHSLDWYYKKLNRRIRVLTLIQRFRPIIIGEWSGVISGESLKGVSDSDAKKHERQHYELQRDAYEAFTGSFYWSYKTETNDLNYWNYRSVIETK